MHYPSVEFLFQKVSRASKDMLLIILILLVFIFVDEFVVLEVNVVVVSIVRFIRYFWCFFAAVNSVQRCYRSWFVHSCECEDMQVI